MEPTYKNNDYDNSYLCQEGLLLISSMDDKVDNPGESSSQMCLANEGNVQL